MTVCGIENDNVNLGFNKSCNPVENIGGNTYTCSAEKSSLLILGCIGILDGLLNILDGDQTLEIIILINDGKLFFSGFSKDLLGFLEGDTLSCGDKILACHAFFDLLGIVCFEFKITICDDTYELSSLCNGNT